MNVERVGMYVDMVNANKNFTFQCSKVYIQNTCEPSPARAGELSELRDKRRGAPGDAFPLLGSHVERLQTMSDISRPQRCRQQQVCRLLHRGWYQSQTRAYVCARSPIL